MVILVVVGVFIFTLLLINQGSFIVKMIYKPELRKMHQRLRLLSMSGHGNEAIDILKKKTLSQIPWLNRILLNLSFVARIERFLGQADTRQPLGVFVMLSVMLFLAGLFTAMVLRLSIFAMALPSVLLAAAPFLYLYHKKKKRMEKFERQLPEALELISRSLKAGHAFTGGLKMAAEEFGDPVGVEFGRTLDEISFGVGVPEALTNLTQRIECEDLKFFVVSVIIQRETGGNLAEILDSLSCLIRERFKFQGRVRVLSGEGRISAIVLVAIPFCIAGFFSLTRPEYIRLLISDPIGRVFVMTASVMMGFGIFVMKRMVSIKV